jgi:hypothetical protein
MTVQRITNEESVYYAAQHHTGSHVTLPREECLPCHQIVPWKSLY